MSKDFVLRYEIGLPASRLWAALKSFHLIFPRLVPGSGDRMDVIEGKPGEAGCVMKISFGATKGGPTDVFSKERLAFVDENEMILQTEEIEGGHLGFGFKKWQTTTQLVPLGLKRVEMVVRVEYECDPECAVSDMVIEQSKEGIPVTFKAVESFVLSTNLFP